MGIIVMKLLLIVATALGLKFESGLERPKDNQALLYSVTRYSDELANGDSADDKDLHEEGDMNDDVVTTTEVPIEATDPTDPLTSSLETILPPSTSEPSLERLHQFGAEMENTVFNYFTIELFA